MMFPKDNIRELNRRLRHYYQYNPYIRNIIELHASFPLSDFEMKCEEKENGSYYNDFKDRLNLLEHFIQMGRDFWLLGEAFSYGNWNIADLEFESFNQFPPEEVEIYKTYITKEAIYYVRPNEDVMKMLQSNKPADKALVEAMEKLNPDFITQMRKKKPYPLANERLIHLAQRPNKYTLRGISPVLSVVKDLIYEDKLRMLLYTFVDRHTFPIKIFKLGDKIKGWIPNKSKILEFQRLLLQAVNDPDFNIITNPFVEVDYVVGKDKIMDLLPHFEFVKKRIQAGLFVNDAVLHGELGPYASQAISVRILMGKYITYRNLLENAAIQKIFKPLAIARKMYKKRSKAELAHNVRTRKPELDLPRFFWQKLNLLSNTTLQEYVMRLRDKEEVPFKYVAELFDWDPEVIKKEFKEEQSTELDPLWRKLREERATKDEKVGNQVLDGLKVEKWTIKEKPKIVMEEERAPISPEIRERISPLEEPKTSMPEAPAVEKKVEEIPETPKETSPIGEEELTI